MPRQKGLSYHRKNRTSLPIALAIASAAAPAPAVKTKLKPPPPPVPPIRASKLSKYKKRPSSVDEDDEDDNESPSAKPPTPTAPVTTIYPVRAMQTAARMRIAVDAMQKKPPPPRVPAPPSRSPKHMKYKKRASVDDDDEYPSAATATATATGGTKSPPVDAIATDVNILAKAIKELNDPLLKKFITDCLIQYNKLVVKLPPVPTAGTSETPDQIEFNRKMRPSKESLIRPRGICFERNKFGKHRTAGAQRQAKFKAVRDIKDALINNNLTKEQKVLALASSASADPQLRSIFKSAGMVDQKKYRIYCHIFKNMRQVLKLACATNHPNRRTSDDLKSLVQTVVLCTLSPTNDKNSSKPSYSEISEILGMPASKYRRIAIGVAHKRDKLENGEKGTIFSQVIKSRGWTKVDAELLKKIHDFVRNHPHLVQYPIANDMATVKDEESGLPIKVPKLLLQIPIRVLHNDLLKKLPEARDSHGNALASDTKLRQILPKELRRMSERYKIMCACLQYLKIQYLQSDYNKYKKLLLKSMENKRDLLCSGTRQWSQLNTKLALYKNEIRIDPRPCDAVRRVQCQPIDNDDSNLEDLTHIDCVLMGCASCVPNSNYH